MLLDFNNGCLKRFLFQEELTRYYDKCKYVFYKIPNIIVEFQTNLIFHHRLLRNIQILGKLNMETN
jgi:hypothetical protein